MFAFLSRQPYKLLPDFILQDSDILLLSKDKKNNQKSV